VEVWEWLGQIDQAPEASPKSELEYLKFRAHRFMVLTDQLPFFASSFIGSVGNRL
jgi:hypothetical protein